MSLPEDEDWPVTFGGSGTAARVTVGRISGIFGVEGWVKIYSYTRPKENVFNYSPWLIGSEGRWDEYVPVGGHVHGKGLLALLQGLDDRDVARGLIGREIAIRRAQLPPPPPGEYYWADLLGLPVVNREGVALGRLKELLETGAHDVLVVEGSRRYLIPLVAKVYFFGVEDGAIRVDWGEDY